MEVEPAAKEEVEITEEELQATLNAAGKKKKHIRQIFFRSKER
jgi:hypothetical protein